MPLSLAPAEALQFHAYGSGYVEILSQGQLRRETQSCLLAPDSGITAWPFKQWAEIDNEAWREVIAAKPEVFILGTGDKQRFLHPKQTQALAQAGIAVEAMNTGAACRTFNVLQSEGRRVVAAIFIEETV
jgi:uncharacterized protein